MGAASRIESLERRVRADPSSVAFASLADEYRRAGRLGEAVEASRSGLERHPAYASARVTLARALQELGHLDEARAEFETVLGFAPENLAAIRGLADIHRQLGDRAGTLQYLQRALTLAPLDGELRNAIAEAEERMAAAPAAPPPLAVEPELQAPPEPVAPPAPVHPPVAEALERLAPSDSLVADEAESGFGELPGFEPPFDLPLLEVPAEVLEPVAAGEQDTETAPVEPATDEPGTEPFPFDARPFAQVEPSEPESADDARTPEAPDRLDRLRRQKAALDRFLAEILKERDRRAS